MHISKELLNNEKMIDQEKIDLVARMGGNWYCRTDSNSMFEIKKPISTKGIGFDKMPTEVLNSTILSGMIWVNLEELKLCQMKPMLMNLD